MKLDALAAEALWERAKLIDQAWDGAFELVRTAADYGSPEWCELALKALEQFERELPDLATRLGAERS